MVDLRLATTDDFAFLYDLHKAAMKEYVAQIWGWDEEWQQRYFAEHFAPALSQVITLHGQKVGVIAIVQRNAELFIHNIEILPEYQRQGIGAIVLKDVIDEGQRQGKPVTLQVLKINPARKLYERLGFVVTGETETHYLMKAG